MSAPHLAELVTARALRVALDRSLTREDACARLVAAARGDRQAASTALGRLERAHQEDPDPTLARAVDALRSAVGRLPDPGAHERTTLVLLPPMV